MEEKEMIELVKMEEEEEEMWITVLEVGRK